MRCPIRGHQHDLRVQREIRNLDGAEANVWECPKGNDRWFALAGRTEVSPHTRMKKPRWGWRT